MADVDFDAAFAPRAAAPSEPDFDAAFTPKTDKPPEYKPSWGDYGRSLEAGAALNWGDELNASARHYIGGEDYNTALADERNRLAAFHEAHPYLDNGLQFAGGLVTPGGLMLKGLKPAASVAGRLAQGAKIGAGFGAVAGAGEVESGKNSLVDQAMDTAGGALKGAVAGSVVGAALPVAGSMVSKTGNRLAEMATPVLENLGLRNDNSAVRAIARALADEGKSPADIETALTRMRADAQIGPNSPEFPVALTDTTPGLKKVMGSAMRGSPEADADTRQMLYARQTGQKLDAAAPDYPNVPTRPRLVSQGQGPAAGQNERVLGALQDALGIPNTRAGLKPTAFQTNEQITAAREKAANSNWEAFRRAGDTVDISGNVGYIRGVALQNLALNRNNTSVAREIRRAANELVSEDGAPLHHVDALDAARRTLSDRINSLYNSPSSANSAAAKALEPLRDDIVNLLSNVKQNGIGDKFKSAMNVYSGDSRMIDALKAGQSALEKHPDAAIGEYNALGTQGERDLYRQGVFGSFQKQIGNAKKTADATAAFESPNTQKILAGLAPNPAKIEQFGRYLGNEQNIANTARKTIGGPDTAHKLQDDAAFAQKTMLPLVSALKANPSLGGIARTLIAHAGQFAFGMNEDMARNVAQHLLTTDPVEQQRFIQGLSDHMNPQQFSQFRTALERLNQLALAGRLNASADAGAAFNRASGP